MKAIITAILGGTLVNNYVFAKFLGINTVTDNAKNKKQILKLGVTVTIVMVISACISWALSTYCLVPFGFEYLSTLCTVVVIVAVSALVCKPEENKPVNLGLTVLNSAVLGLCTNVSGLEMVDALLTSVYAGVGFIVAMYVFSGIKTRLNEKFMPAAFRGYPCDLLIASIIALAVMAFK